MTQTFYVGTTRPCSISTNLNVNKSLWFQHCKDILQKIVLTHKEISDMPFTMMFEDNVMFEQFADSRLHKDHQSIILRILGFYSNVNIVLSKINIRCVIRMCH